jgi:hypothetical protein
VDSEFAQGFPSVVVAEESMQAPDSEVFFQVELGFQVSQAIDSLSKRVRAFSEGCQFLSLGEEDGAALGLPSSNVGNQKTNEHKILEPLLRFACAPM